MWRLVTFAIVSLGIVRISWVSLRDLRSHGFYRFFAFESILGLFLLNVEYWLREPFSAQQVVSWFLLIASLYLVVSGFYLLRRVGKPKGGIESTTTLVTRGVYRYIRHPLYSSLLLLGWGIFFKDLSLLGSIMIIAALAFLIATAKVEETENLRKFGAEYVAYAKTTRMFIPFLF